MNKTEDYSEIIKEWREKYPELEKQANEFLAYKCNKEQMPRYKVVREYGLEAFEQFWLSKLKTIEERAREEIASLVDTDGHVNEDKYEKWLEDTKREGLYDGMEVGNGIRFVLDTLITKK